MLRDLEGRSESARKARSDWGEKHATELFDFTKICHHLGIDIHDVRPATGFNRYNPDFIYRYVRVPQLTVEQLVDIANLRGDDIQRFANSPRQA